MKSEQTRARALRRQLTATFYRKNKATFFVTAGAMLLLGGALLAVAWILQQIIDIASGDSVAPLVRMCWLCLGVLVSVTTIYVVQCYTYPAFLRRAMKQYKEYAFTELTKKSISTFSDENTSRYISALTNDAVCIETNYLAKIFTLLTKSVSFVGGLVMMLLYSPLLTGFALLLAVPTAICVRYDAWPPITWVLRGLLGVAPIYWTVGTIEVLTYVPMLGTGGSYLGFFTGNLTSLKVPCALNAMEAADVEPGTEAGEVISTIAIAVSALVTTAVIAVGVLLLSQIRGFLESPVLQPAFDNILPALFGPLAVVYVAKNWKVALTPLVFMITLFICVPSLASSASVLVPVGALLAIGAARILYKKGLV